MTASEAIVPKEGKIPPKSLRKREPVKVIRSAPAEGETAIAGRPRPLFLQEEFAHPPPHKHSVEPSRWMDNRHKRYILYCYMERVTIRTISKEIGYGGDSIYNMIVKAMNEPLMFLEWGFMANTTVGQRGYAGLWVCRYCGATYRQRRPAAKHAFCHIWGPDIFPIKGV